MAGSFRCSRRLMLGGGAALALAARAGAMPAASAPRQFTLDGPDGRSIAITEWVPKGPVRGTILFSHGAGSGPAYYDLLIAPWVASGHGVLAPLHVDSREHPRTREFAGLASWKARLEDMAALIGHIGDTPFVAAGHSYGGLVALTLGGAAPVPPAGWQGPLVPRLARAVLAFSPPAPIPVLVTAAGYGALQVPALVQTGTKDIVPGITTLDPDGWKTHLAGFENPPPGGHRYGLVIEGANHYFGGVICDPTQPGPPQRAEIAQASRVAGLFLAAFGDGDSAARGALDAMVTDSLPVRLMKR